MKIASQTTAPASHIGRSLRRTLLTGGIIVGAFFFCFGGWAAWAPLSGSAVARGFISPEGNRRVVQHLEGGIVKKLMVKSGSMIVAGQPLIELDSGLARAKYQSVLKEYRANLARQSRLLAERSGWPDMTFPADEWGTDDIELARDMFDAERDLFFSRITARDTERRILRQRIVQLNDEIAGIEAQIDSQTDQLALIRKEAKGIEGLVDRGFERRPRLLALKREESESLGLRAASMADLARAKSKIGETEIEIASLDSSYREEVETQLSEVRAKLAKLNEELRASVAVLGRTIIRAPVSGIAMKLRIHTEGGVITAGEPILDIVPSDDELLIDVRIMPNDIDEVRAGLPARVVLTGFSVRNTPQLNGSVKKVSADRLVDEKTGEVYYRAFIELPVEHVRKVAPQIDLKAGMPADVMVMTGQRTLLDYLIEPITSSFRLSFNES